MSLRSIVLIVLSTCAATALNGGILACQSNYSLAELSGNSVECTLDGTTVGISNFLVTTTLTGTGGGNAAQLDAMLIRFTAFHNVGNLFSLAGNGIGVTLTTPGGVLLRDLFGNAQYSVTMQYDVSVLSGGLYAMSNGATVITGGSNIDSWQMVVDANKPQGPFSGIGNTGHSATPPNVRPPDFFGIERIDFAVPERLGFTVRTSLTASWTGSGASGGLVLGVTNVFILPEPPTGPQIGFALICLALCRRVLRQA